MRPQTTPATFERSGAAFDNPDHVAIVIHNYRWRLGLAAVYLSLSPSLFRKLVTDGRMPRPRLADGRRIYDFEELDMAFKALPREGEDAESSDVDRARLFRKRRFPAHTQHVYRLVIERLLRDENIGHRLVNQMTRKHIVQMIGKRAATPGAANDVLKKLKILIHFAVDNGWRREDPTVRLKGFHRGRISHLDG
jgi:hypothetical protein